MIGATQISKKEFYNAGGFSNTSQYRKMSGGFWKYYRLFK